MLFTSLLLSLALESACPVPAGRLYASFAALHNHTDAEVFAMTCLDDLVEAGGVEAILGRLRGDKRPLEPMQAALLLRWLQNSKEAEAGKSVERDKTARSVRTFLQQSLNAPRPVMGYWTDPRMELRQSKDARSKLVAVQRGKGIGTGGVAKASGDAYVDPVEVTLLQQTAEQARVRVRGATGWVDKRKLILPAVLGFRGPDDQAPLVTFVRPSEELVVLRVDAASFLLGFPTDTPAAGLTMTCDRISGEVTAIGHKDAAEEGSGQAPKTYFGGRDCVSFAANRAAGHALVQPGLSAEGRFFVHGWPADCRY
jgi:hypothetical protein